MTGPKRGISLLQNWLTVGILGIVVRPRITEIPHDIYHLDSKIIRKTGFYGYEKHKISFDIKHRRDRQFIWFSGDCWFNLLVTLKSRSVEHERIKRLMRASLILPWLKLWTIDYSINFSFSRKSTLRKAATSKLLSEWCWWRYDDGRMIRCGMKILITECLSEWLCWRANSTLSQT